MLVRQDQNLCSSVTKRLREINNLAVKRNGFFLRPTSRTSMKEKSFSRGNCFWRFKHAPCVLSNAIKCLGIFSNYQTNGSFAVSGLCVGFLPLSVLLFLSNTQHSYNQATHTHRCTSIHAHLPVNIYIHTVLGLSFPVLLEGTTSCSSLIKTLSSWKEHSSLLFVEDLNFFCVSKVIPVWSAFLLIKLKKDWTADWHFAYRSFHTCNHCFQVASLFKHFFQVLSFFYYFCLSCFAPNSIRSRCHCSLRHSFILFLFKLHLFACLIYSCSVDPWRWMHEEC